MQTFYSFFLFPIFFNFQIVLILLFFLYFFFFPRIILLYHFTVLPTFSKLFFIHIFILPFFLACYFFYHFFFSHPTFISFVTNILLFSLHFSCSTNSASSFPTHSKWRWIAIVPDPNIWILILPPIFNQTIKVYWYINKDGAIPSTTGPHL